MLDNWKKLSFIPQSNGRKAKIEYTKYFEEFLEHCWQNIILEKSMWHLLHYKLIKTMAVSSLSQSQKFWQNQEIKAEAVAEIIRTRILERIVVPWIWSTKNTTVSCFSQWHSFDLRVTQSRFPWSSSSHCLNTGSFAGSFVVYAREPSTYDFSKYKLNSNPNALISSIFTIKNSG